MRLLLQRARCNVLAIVHAFETDARDRGVGMLYRGREICSPRRYAQHTPSGRVIERRRARLVAA